MKRLIYLALFLAGCVPTKHLQLGEPVIVETLHGAYTYAKIGELYHVLAPNQQVANDAINNLCGSNYCQVQPQGSYYMIQVTPKQ